MTIQDGFRSSWLHNLNHHITNTCNVLGHNCTYEQYVRIYNDSVLAILTISSKISNRNIFQIAYCNTLCEEQILKIIKDVLNINQ